MTTQEQSQQQERPKEGGFRHPYPGMPAYVYVGSGGTNGEVYVEYNAQQEDAREVRVMANPDGDFCNKTPPVGGTPLTQDSSDPFLWTGCVPNVPCNSDGTEPFELGARERYFTGWAPCNHASGFMGQCADGDCCSKQ